MEDYDKFVQRRLSQLRKSVEEEEEDNKPLTASSLICFYGRAILPPLLSGEQREEMHRHRDAAQKAADHRRLKDDHRLAYVQNMLQSVPLRKTPTLEELLRETEINTEYLSSHSANDRAETQNKFFVQTNDSVSLSPPAVRNEKDGVSLPPMTSTTYSAFFTCNVTPQQRYHKGCLIDQHNSQQGSQPSSLSGACHSSVSSGYVTHENVENAISFSGTSELGSGSHGFGSSEGVYNMGTFFLHNTSNTVAKMPDIINYPPIDGEELERSGLESSFSNNSKGTKDICCTSFQENLVTCDHLPGEKLESNHLVGTEDEENSPFSTVLDLDKDHSFDRIEVPEVSENNPEISLTLNTHHCPKTGLHIQPDPIETEPTDETEPSEEPYRLSLQALLKKSQEYRRRQRMLRNQAKNTKIQERTQQQPRARTEEQSHSDKENDEFPYKGTVTAGGKKTKDGRGSFIPTLETSAKKSWENERMIESSFVGKKINIKSESTYLTGDGKTKEMPSVEEDSVFKNNKLNSSQEVITEPKEIGAVVQQQPMSTDTSEVQEAFYLTSCPTALYKGAGKYHTIPVPNLCRSPVHCKSRNSSKDGEAADGAENVVGNTELNDDHKTDVESNLGYQSGHTPLASSVSVIVEHDVPTGMDLARSSQHIDQLESSLKVLISDSTVNQNLENHDQTQSNTQSECNFKGIKHSEQIKNHQHVQQSDDYLKDKLNDDDCNKEAAYRQWPSSQSFDNRQNMHKDTRSEPRLSDTDEVPFIVQGKGTEIVNISELRLVKNITAERKKEKWTGKEALTKTYHCRKQQPSAKCILSVAQRMRIPDVFRNVPPESTVPCNVSVLSDTSNHPVESRNESFVKDHDSTHSPSLNQSYDVDTPSDLWLLDQSGSDLGSKSPPAQEKHLTPESGGEGQGGMSKVKRRLLMHRTEETQESRSPDRMSREAGSMVRPNSSTPRVQVYGGHGSQKDKQEQLKQVHAAQIRALQDQHQRQHEELLQALAVRYHLLQSVSFPCSTSASRLGDTLTFSTLSQPSSSSSECYRPLLLAAVKGFLTRRLLRTERVAQLVRTIRDTQQFLQAFQQQSPTSKQDLLLQERVTLQLRAARYEVYDIFFSLSARERMQLISWDRELARERELRQQSGHTGQPRRKSSLSTATQKSLERKRGIMTQKKAVERHRGVVTRTGHKSGFSAEQPLETKRGQFRANPQRVPKSAYSSRPR